MEEEEGDDEMGVVVREKKKRCLYEVYISASHATAKLRAQRGGRNARWLRPDWRDHVICACGLGSPVLCCGAVRAVDSTDEPGKAGTWPVRTS